MCVPQSLADAMVLSPREALRKIILVLVTSRQRRYALRLAREAGMRDSQAQLILIGGPAGLRQSSNPVPGQVGDNCLLVISKQTMPANVVASNWCGQPLPGIAALRLALQPGLVAA